MGRWGGCAAIYFSVAIQLFFGMLVAHKSVDWPLCTHLRHLVIVRTWRGVEGANAISSKINYLPKSRGHGVYVLGK